MIDSVLIVLFLIFFLALIVLDLALIISLVKPGDERRQLVIWKASTFTLSGLVGYMILCIIENLMRSSYTAINPFTMLGTTALLYFCALLFFRKKYGG